jgi:Phosphodiester glycosidase
VSDAPGINIDSRNRARVIHRNAAQPNARAVLEPETLWNVVAGSAQILTDGEITVPRYKDANHGDAALTPGGPGPYSNDRSWYDAVNARTAIGLSRDWQTMTLFTVDARGGSTGLSVREMAQRLRDDHGVWNALNLDGGGSTTLAMQDPQADTASVINTSSDNPGGRAVASSLAVFADKK